MAVETHPDKAMSYNLLGWAYTAMEEYDEAEENLQKALSMDPKLDAVHLNLGWLYEKNGQETLAKEYYKKAETIYDRIDLSLDSTLIMHKMQLKSTFLIFTNKYP